MIEVLGKLLSRKLWVTILTIVAVVLGGGQADGIDPTRVSTIVGAGMAALYVIVQGLIDRAKEKAKVASTSLSPEARETLLKLATLVKQSTSAVAQSGAAEPVIKEEAPNTLRSIGIVSIMGLCLGAAVCGTGCATTQTAERPACSEAALAQLEAQFASEVLSACGATPLNQCTQAETIEDAHQKRLEQWAQCQ